MKGWGGVLRALGGLLAACGEWLWVWLLIQSLRVTNPAFRAAYRGRR